MGHSITTFRQGSFTSRDWKLEVWLLLLVTEIDRHTHIPPWLAEVRHYWHDVGHGGAANGCINLCLNEYLIDEERVGTLRQLVQRATGTLSRFGEQIPRGFLNTLCELAPPEQFSGDIPAESLLPCGCALLSLLDGQITGHTFV